MDVTPELIAKFTTPGMTAEGARRVVKEMVEERNKLETMRSRAKVNQKFWKEKVSSLDAEIAVLEEALLV